MKMFSSFLIAAALLAAPGLAVAQTGAAGGDAHGSHMTPSPAQPAAAQDSPSTRAYRAAATHMHKAMDIPYTGNADVDFMRGMIAHHQGAIDMAQVVLTYGSDPQVRKLAQEIIAAQQSEIRMMKDWLAAHGQ